MSNEKIQILTPPVMSFEKVMSREEMLMRLQAEYGINGADIIMAQCDSSPEVYQRVKERILGITNNASFLEITPVSEKRKILTECGLSPEAIDILCYEPPDFFTQIEGR